MKERSMNKKGAELAIGTLVLIVLALVVLAVVIYGFSVGWGNLFQSIVGFGGGQVNVQTESNACNLVACSQASRSPFDYCGKIRNVKFTEDQTEKYPHTCLTLEATGAVQRCDSGLDREVCRQQTVNALNFEKLKEDFKNYQEDRNFPKEPTLA